MSANLTLFLFNTALVERQPSPILLQIVRRRMNYTFCGVLKNLNTFVWVLLLIVLCLSSIEGDG